LKTVIADYANISSTLGSLANYLIGEFDFGDALYIELVVQPELALYGRDIQNIYPQ